MKSLTVLIVANIMNISSRLNFQTIFVSNVHSLVNPQELIKIPAKIMRITSLVLLKSITEIFIGAILFEVVLSEWKPARVVPLHKKGKKHLLKIIIAQSLFCPL